MTPGIQPKQVRIKTMRIDPQPRSNTANGGKMMDSITLNTDMLFCFLVVLCEDTKIRRSDKNVWGFTVYGLQFTVDCLSRKIF